MSTITLDFDEDGLKKAIAAYDKSNDKINGMGDADAYESTWLFDENDQIRLWLAEMLYDAYRNSQN